MVVKKKMQTFAKNYEVSFKRLAKLQNIPLKKGWKKAIANFFNIEQSLLSNWFKRGIPNSALEHASVMGYPPELWYDEPDGYSVVPETLGIPRREDTRNPASSLSYAAPPEHLDGFSTTQLYEQIDIKLDPRHRPIVEKVIFILESGEADTIETLRMSVNQLEWKIIEKSKNRELNATIESILERQNKTEMLLHAKSKELDAIKKELTKEKSISDSLVADPVDPAENE
jgi:hypothetical protein